MSASAPAAAQDAGKDPRLSEQRGQNWQRNEAASLDALPALASERVAAPVLREPCLSAVSGVSLKFSSARHKLLPFARLRYASYLPLPWAFVEEAPAARKEHHTFGTADQIVNLNNRTLDISCGDNLLSD